MLREKVAEKLRRFRVDNKIKQHELCRLLEVSYPTYSRMERGLTDITLVQAYKFTKYFDLEPWFFMETEFDFEPYQNKKYKEIKNHFPDFSHMQIMRVMDYVQKKG